jgi:hypothetical protein
LYDLRIINVFMTHCEPANSIIVLLGGIRPVALAADTTETTVRRWRLPIESGGTGGFIPRKKFGALTDFARSKGIELPVTAFFELDAVPLSKPNEAA